MRPLLLDLFCGAGGAAMGYHRAGFDVVGVDIDPQPNYPFEFVQADALNPPFDLASFDAIHASPPCQAYSVQTTVHTDHPDLIDPTRQLLQGSGLPYVIENVPGAPLLADIRLCGSMFGMQIQRHRYFELSGFPMLLTPPCNHKAWEGGRPWTVTGTGGGGKRKHSWMPLSADHSADLMGMPRGYSKKEYSEAIPPAYTEWIGTQLLNVLDI